MTKKQLDLFTDQPVPLEIVMQRIVMLGTSGAGKTWCARSLAELLWIDHRVRWGAFDSAEDWWGLTSTADGTAAAIPVVIFGGEHSSGIPLPSSGTEFARIVAKLEQPWIADLKELPKPRRQLFVAEATAELLRINKGNPLVLFVDEADTFAPETAKSKEAQRALDAMEDAAKRGRKQGVYPVFITQRNAAIAKDVVDLCQVALLFRAPGANDQKVAIGYLGNTVGKREAEEILVELESLPDGECFVVSKAPKMTMRARVKVRQPATFDSSATPGLGQRRREPKVLAVPDIAAIKEQLAKQIAEEREHDPAALREERNTERRLRKDLERQVEQLKARPPAPKPVEVPVLGNGSLKALKKISADWLRSSEALLRSEMAATERAAAFRTTAGERAVGIKPVLSALDRITSAPSTGVTETGRGAPDGSAVRRSPGSTVAPVVRAGNGGGALDRPATSALSPGSAPARERQKAPDDRPARTTEGITTRQQRFLDAAATLETLGVEATRETVAGWLGVHPRGGSVGEELKALVDAGYVTYGRGQIAVTLAGHNAAGEMPASEAIERAVSGLSPRQRRIFEIIRGVHPDAITREGIAEQMGIHPRGGSFGEDLGRLRGRGLIEYERGQARARDFLFVGAGA